MDYFEFGPMNKQEMIEYLSEMESLGKKLPKLIEEANANVETMEESIQRNNFHHPEMGDGGSASSRAAGDKVYSTLMASYRDMERQSEVLRKEEARYKAAQNKLNLIKRCIKALPNDTEKDLIVEVYVKHTPFKSYGFFHNMSRSCVYRTKESALKNLLENYNNNFKNSKEGERS